MRNKIEVGLQDTTTGHLNARIHERHTPQILAPHPHQTTALTPPVNGTKVWIHSARLVNPEDDSPALNYEEANTFQQVVGSFLYYAQAVYTKMLVLLNTIAAQQYKNTQETAKKVVQLLNYAAPALRPSPNTIPAG